MIGRTRSNFISPTSNFQLQHRLLTHNHQPTDTQDQVWGVGLHVYKTFGGVLRRSSSIDAAASVAAVFDFVPSYTFFVFGGGGPPRPGGTSVKCVTIT